MLVLCQSLSYLRSCRLVGKCLPKGRKTQAVVALAEVDTTVLCWYQADCVFPPVASASTTIDVSGSFSIVINSWFAKAYFY